MVGCCFVYVCVFVCVCVCEREILCVCVWGGGRRVHAAVRACVHCYC